MTDSSRVTRQSCHLYPIWSPQCFWWSPPMYQLLEFCRQTLKLQFALQPKWQLAHASAFVHAVPLAVALACVKKVLHMKVTFTSFEHRHSNAAVCGIHSWKNGTRFDGRCYNQSILTNQPTHTLLLHHASTAWQPLLTCACTRNFLQEHFWARVLLHHSNTM